MSAGYRVSRHNPRVKHRFFLDYPNWLVQELAPGIDYYIIAGFPTWREAYDYADRKARS